MSNILETTYEMYANALAEHCPEGATKTAALRHIKTHHDRVAKLILDNDVKLPEVEKSTPDVVPPAPPAIPPLSERLHNPINPNDPASAYSPIQ